MSTAIAHDLFDELRRNMAGQIFRPGAPGYDSARKIFNGMIDRKPSAIAQCTGVADVIAAAQFAQRHGLPVTVRGGGHSAAGYCLADNALLIDLSAMRGVRVDPANWTARGAAGTILSEFDRETQVFGLATPLGTNSTTGLAGLVLGGGVGWLSRRFGLTCDNLLSADVVTAGGRVVHASATENEDLYWGLRGGGGNFGIVTSFEFKLHRVGQVVGGMLIHPVTRARDLYRFHRDYVRMAPDEIVTHVALVTTPDGHPAVAILVCYSGALEHAEKTIRPLREFATPVADLIQTMSYCQMQAMFDHLFPPGIRCYWTGGCLEEVTDEAIDALVRSAMPMPSHRSTVALEYHTGAVSRVAPDATAFSHRGAEAMLVIAGLWSDSTEDEVNIRWGRETWRAMQRYSSGTYSNLLGIDDDGRARASFGANYDRLAALKVKYDPQNFFRHNQNVVPAEE
jgi:FAD/FMN-containing dehydrogenase